MRTFNQNVRPELHADRRQRDSAPLPWDCKLDLHFDFGPACGFVFCTIHIIKANTPIEHVLAMFEVVRECR